MTYATAQEMTARFGEDEMGAFDTATVEAALRDAAVEMDGHLGARYTLPLDAAVAASPLLVRICCDLARYLCWDDTASDRVIEAAKDARKILASLAQGSMVLPGSTGTPATDLAEPEYAERIGPEPVMTPDALEGL